MTESEWAVWCLSCASTWLGASPYGALPLAVPVKARLQRREILQTYNKNYKSRQPVPLLPRTDGIGTSMAVACGLKRAFGWQRTQERSIRRPRGEKGDQRTQLAR